MFTTVALTCYAFALYSGADDGNDDDVFFSKKARYSLFYTSMLASISERFPQLGFIPFISGGLDIIKSLTVGTSLIDDAHFILNATYNLLNVAEKERLEYLSEKEEGYKEDYENILEKYSDLFSNLNNATFKGRTKFDRDITRAIALVPVDNLPILLTLDGLNYLAKQYDVQPEFAKDIRFVDYNLNIYKNRTEIGNMQRAKWYKSLIPTEWIVDYLNSTKEIKGIPVQIYPEKKESGGHKGSISFGHSYGHSFGHKY